MRLPAFLLARDIDMLSILDVLLLLAVSGGNLVGAAQNREASEQPVKSVGPGPDSKSCAFNGTLGPNIMVATVEYGEPKDVPGRAQS